MRARTRVWPLPIRRPVRNRPLQPTTPCLVVKRSRVGKQQSGIGHQAVIVERDTDAEGHWVAASVGCSLFQGGSLFQKPLSPRPGALSHPITSTPHSSVRWIGAKVCVLPGAFFHPQCGHSFEDASHRPAVAYCAPYQPHWYSGLLRKVDIPASVMARAGRRLLLIPDTFAGGHRSALSDPKRYPRTCCRKWLVKRLVKTPSIKISA